VRSRRVSSTQASMGRMSRSEIFSTGDGLTVGGGTSCLDGAYFATHYLVLAFVVGAFLGAADTFGAGFLVLAFLLVLVTGTFIGVSVTSVGLGLGADEGWALGKRPPRSTWFHPLRGSAYQLTAEVEWPPSELLRRVHRFSLQAPQVRPFQGPPWPSSISRSPGSWRCGNPRSRSI
jgi:hypothetical protein